MSKKTHLKVSGVDCRKSGQTEQEYNNQCLCGFSNVTVTRIVADVDCVSCIRKINILKGK